MTPWQKAKQWQDTHDTQDFWELLGEHLSSGYVWNSPKVFMLASEARWNAEEETFESASLTAGSCAWLLLLATQMLCGSFCAWRRSRTNMSAGAGATNLSPASTAGIN
jgi:hypothetical protein